MELTSLKTFAKEARKTLYLQVKSSLDQAVKTDGMLHRNNPHAFYALSKDLKEYGEDTLIRKVAYFWFNRFCALRFMDLNGYTSSKVVSPEQEGSSIPGILSEAKSNYFDDDVITAKTKEKINNLLNGSIKSVNPEAEVYRLLLISSCNFWNKKMPFLFQAEDDYSEYLLPSDLLSPESILQSIRNAMTADNCQSVEIIGWLYQYYISEKKDEIFTDLKKNIKIEPRNIPAATQLFTPEWIVRYLVDNSLGRLWMLNHPESSLKDSMEYYIEPQEEETDFLKISIPQEIKVCDPCCGSGHMLVYAFDLLYKIYEEQGYSNTEIPKLILENNLFGLELDERASELASFALMMKAREKDRRVFGRDVTPQICHLEKIESIDQELLDYQKIVGSDIITSDVIETVKQFHEADNFGSLIIPKLKNPKEVLVKLQNINLDDINLQLTHNKVIQALTTADYLSQKYHVVVTNPPYMGAKGMNGRLATWIKDNYPDSKTDLFSAFIERGFSLILSKGFHSMVTMQSWMFLSSFEKLRSKILFNNRITSMAHMANMVMGIAFGTAATVIQKKGNSKSNGYYCYVELKDIVDEKPLIFPPKNERNKNCTFNGFYKISSDNFKKIPGSPIAYWLSDKFMNIFDSEKHLESVLKSAKGMFTGDNDLFLRLWQEVSIEDICFAASNAEMALLSKRKWVPYNKGGEYRRWYGNQDYLINWENDGYEIKNFFDKNGNLKSGIRNPNLFFKKSITWSLISSSFFGVRCYPTGAIFDGAGPSAFVFDDADYYFILAYLASKITTNLLEVQNPTMNFPAGLIGKQPLPQVSSERKSIISSNSSILIDKHRKDWNSYENSWNFEVNPIIDEFRKDASQSLDATVKSLQKSYKNNAQTVQQLEELNNKYFIELYGLEGEISPDYPLSEVTLFTNTAFMYKEKSEDEQIKLQRVDMIKDLISYSVGCMFGRYSLDKEGLILSESGYDKGFNLLFSGLYVWQILS